MTRMTCITTSQYFIAYIVYMYILKKKIEERIILEWRGMACRVGQNLLQFQTVPDRWMDGWMDE